MAPPNELPPATLLVHPDSRGEVHVDPGGAGWRYLSFRVLRLESGDLVELDPLQEHALVVISGHAIQVAHSSGSLTVDGRASPFAALPEAAYVPAGIRARVTGSGAVVAVASAPSAGRPSSAGNPALIRREDIRVEIRGAGNATRQINHIIAPDFPADRLEVVEVLTPSGNWSSWPPHKHDTDNMPAEAVLEETYCYWFQRPGAWGLQRLYRADRSRDCAWEVRSGDVVLVTDGYHPFVAAQGDDAYYLNALAGDRRTMACSFDPDYDWVRNTWRDLPPDARLPLVR